MTLSQSRPGKYQSTKLKIWKIVIVCFSLAFVANASKCNQKNDPIEKAAAETEKILKGYENIKDKKKVIDWIFSNHGEAAGHQVMVSFAEWSLNHQSDFTTVVEGVEKDKQEEFVERFSNALIDSKLGNRFKEKFKNTNSKIISTVLSKI